MVSSQELIARDFLIFNRSLAITLHRTPSMLFIVETEKQQYFKEVLDCLEIDFPKLPLFKYFG